MTAAMKLTQTRIRAGVWEGILSLAAEPGDAHRPELELCLQGRALPGLTLTPVPGRSREFAVRAPIPAEMLSEGVQTFQIRHRADKTGAALAHFTLITGVALEADLRAEFDLLRAELDLLKRAFRHHCLETTGETPAPAVQPASS